MPARTTRQEARDRLLKTMLAALDRIIPADESKPLRGTTFGNWEDQTDAFKRAVLVIGMDGGRWQSRDKDAATDSRWREDKVLLPGQRLADRVGRNRGGRQAVQQAREGDGTVLAGGGDRTDPEPAGRLDQSRRPMAALLGQPTRVCQLSVA